MTPGPLGQLKPNELARTVRKHMQRNAGCTLASSVAEVRPILPVRYMKVSDDEFDFGR